jgi:ATPase family associated with various cellular activities (AAA)
MTEVTYAHDRDGTDPANRPRKVTLQRRRHHLQARPDRRARPLPVEGPGGWRPATCAWRSRAVGLAERGPVATPVAPESSGAFRELFGDAGGGRLLPQAVHQFFANRGRRCVVVRALNYGAAGAASFELPGLRLRPTDFTGPVVPALVFARSPGAGANGGSGRCCWSRRAAPFADSWRPAVPWSRLVLEPRARARLADLVRWVRHRATVQDRWAMRDPSGRGDGLIAFVHGPSGTGKTLAAAALATRLELPLLQVDLARVVSKY